MKSFLDFWATAHPLPHSTLNFHDIQSFVNYFITIYFI
jgi:hypothetical protein